MQQGGLEVAAKEAAFSHVLEDGRIVEANSFEEVVSICPVIGKMAIESPDAAKLLVELSAIGNAKIKADSANSAISLNADKYPLPSDKKLAPITEAKLLSLVSKITTQNMPFQPQKSIQTEPNFTISVSSASETTAPVLDTDDKLIISRNEAQSLSAQIKATEELAQQVTSIASIHSTKDLVSIIELVPDFPVSATRLQHAAAKAVEANQDVAFTLKTIEDVPIAARGHKTERILASEQPREEQSQEVSTVLTAEPLVTPAEPRLTTELTAELLPNQDVYIPLEPESTELEAELEGIYTQSDEVSTDNFDTPTNPFEAATDQVSGFTEPVEKAEAIIDFKQLIEEAAVQPEALDDIIQHLQPLYQLARLAARAPMLDRETEQQSSRELTPVLEKLQETLTELELTAISTVEVIPMEITEIVIQLFKKLGYEQPEEILEELINSLSVSEVLQILELTCDKALAYKTQEHLLTTPLHVTKQREALRSKLSKVLFALIANGQYEPTF